MMFILSLSWAVQRSKNAIIVAVKFLRVISTQSECS